ncbi:MAG TPA: TonB-dependent receptor, partial [Bryobacteraceae bacterium]|nr:TonB-dependent receptor [Bryobacteraceae bacterium]
MKLLLCIVLFVCLAPGFAAGQGGPPAADVSNLDLEQLMQIKVEAASLHEQSLADAPASVTVITQDEIRRYGWRTLAEALSSARGIYTFSDRTFTYGGVRGFSLPGDYGQRVLLMVNGHNMADNIVGESNRLAEDFPLDMTLVKRIEIIRGPSSALYGTHGIFLTINVVTFSPEELSAAEIHTESGSLGEKKIQAMTSVSLPHGALLLLSGSVFNDNGDHSIYFLEANTPATNHGRAIDMNGQKGYHLFGDFIWNGWSVTALFGTRSIIQPVSFGDTIFNDRGTRLVDSRNFIDATYTQGFGSSRTLEWRTSYDSYNVQGIYHLVLDPGADILEDNRDVFHGAWLGSQLTYRLPVRHFGSVTIGTSATFELRTLMQNFDVQPVYHQYLSVDRRDKQFAVFAQDEWDLTRKWKLNLGARFDFSALLANSFSPRAALIYQPSTRVSYKFLYGRAFRNPSALELFYNVPFADLGNPSARPERANTFEFVFERKLTQKVNALLSVYRYGLSGLLVGVTTPSGLLQYQNTDNVRASGMEVELNGYPVPWLEIATSMALQRAVDSSQNATLNNSPGRIGKLRFSVPLFTSRFSLASSMQYVGPRRTLDRVSLLPVFHHDITISAKRLPGNLELQAGVRDLWGARYSDPSALNDRYDTV